MHQFPTHPYVQHDSAGAQEDDGYASKGPPGVRHSPG